MPPLLVRCARGAVRHRYAILAALGIMGLLIALWPGIATLLGLEGQLVWVFLVAMLALLVSGLHYMAVLFHRQRVMMMHFQRHRPVDPAQRTKELVALEMDVEKTDFH